MLCACVKVGERRGEESRARCESLGRLDSEHRVQENDFPPVVSVSIQVRPSPGSRTVSVPWALPWAAGQPAGTDPRTTGAVAATCCQGFEDISRCVREEQGKPRAVLLCPPCVPENRTRSLAAAFCCALPDTFCLCLLPQLLVLAQNVKERRIHEGLGWTEKQSRCPALPGEPGPLCGGARVPPRRWGPACGGVVVLQDRTRVCRSRPALKPSCLDKSCLEERGFAVSP